MSATLAPEQSVIRTPEEPLAPKPIEEVRQPLGPAEEKMAQTIDALRDGHTTDPDKSFQAIVDSIDGSIVNATPESSQAAPYMMPTELKPEEQVMPIEKMSTEGVLDKVKTAAGRITQETDPQAASKLRQEMGDVVANHISQLPEDRVSAFIAEFNRDNLGLLKSQEFRLLQSQGEKVVIVDEAGNLGEMIVTKENARSALGEIKSKDETLRGRSYELRKEILKRSTGEITTHEAYTYAVTIPQGGELDPFLDNPENWVSERIILHQQIVDEEYTKALALSARLEDSEPTVYALRGNTAAGKTTAIRNDELFRKSLDSAGEPSGAINPDTYKSELKVLEAVGDRQVIGHQQAHEEGSLLARKISARIAESESSMVIDKRMNKARNIAELLVVAQENGKSVKLLDVDVPLEVSLIRVLGRKIGGKDPIVPFDAVAEGFDGVRNNRAALIEDVINNPIIKYYALYVADESGTSIKVAQKTNGEFMVIAGQEEAFIRATSPDTESTHVSQMAATVITDEYITKILGITPEGVQAKIQTSLERYKGKTLKEALDLHAKKINED